MAEELEGAEVTEYKLTPELIEVMVIATSLLEDLSRGKITISEARAIYESKIIPVIKELQAKSRPASKSKKKSSSKKKSKTTSKSSSKTSRSKRKKKSG